MERRDEATPHQFVAAADEAGQRLDVFLSQHLPGLSRSRAQRLIQQGEATVDGRTALRPSTLVAAGAAVGVRLPAPEPDIPTPEDLPLTILHDDDDIVVIDKAAGMVVHPAAGHVSGTLVNALLFHVAGLSGIGGRMRPGIVHRLDKGTSGVMVVAKNDRAHLALSRQFHDRLVQKTYTALVWGRPEAGRVFDRPLGRDPKNREKMSSRGRRTRSASTRIDRVESFNGVSLVDVTIGSGRTHQIRVHLSEAHFPIVGDSLYGGRKAGAAPGWLTPQGRPFLHASRLSFHHPADGRLVSFEAPLPGPLQAIVDRLRRSSQAASPQPQVNDRNETGGTREEG